MPCYIEKLYVLNLFRYHRGNIIYRFLRIVRALAELFKLCSLKLIKLALENHATVCI